MEEKLLFFLLFLLSYPLSPSAYTLPNHYFINCGSETNATINGRNFIGDQNTAATTFSFTKQSTSVLSENQTSNSTHLYKTARTFQQQSSYTFNIDAAGIHLVRLHFFNSTKLSTSLFDVSASEFPLLQNFTTTGSNLNFPLVHEFLLNIQKGKFSISFTPKGNSSLAFVNAIEVFLAPENFIPDQAPHISPENSIRNFSGIPSRGLRTSYRINVGGETVITPDNDTLWRTWIPDQSFLFNPKTATNKNVTAAPKYLGAVTKFIAPDYVYQTAKELIIYDDRSNSNTFNVTWTFKVPKNSSHFLRLHFSNITGTNPDSPVFNLFINGYYGQKNVSGNLETPFFFDFVFDSDDSGLFNVSIGNRVDKGNAFLNGVELMQILRDTNPESSGKKTVFIVAGVVGGLILISAVAICLFIVMKKRKTQQVESTSIWSPVYRLYGGGSTHSKVNDKSATNFSLLPNLNLGLKIPLSELQSGTNNFDKKLQIGKGGFGNVYRGTLKNGTKVAVKRSQPGSGQGLPEFQTEIMVLSKIRHRHLVSLIGYCDEKFEMILVYELMEKGTLRDHLYKTKFPSLSWKQRLEICIGAARGLHYLHKGSTEGIIHRDVKSTNILLDENLVAKVADFGLSKETPMDQNYISCTGVKGTFGYLDPEYFRTQQLTEKSDVYSFGVVLLEVLCARPALCSQLPRDQVNLGEWGVICYKKGLIETIVDPVIRDEINPNSLKKFVEAAEKCLQEDGADRPNMGDVVWDLEYALQLQQTAVSREPHEYSGTDVGSGLVELQNMQRLPSVSMPFEDDELPIMKDDGDDSVFYASEIFSQLRIDGAR